MYHIRCWSPICSTMQYMQYMIPNYNEIRQCNSVCEMKSNRRWSDGLSYLGSGLRKSAVISSRSWKPWCVCELFQLINHLSVLLHSITVKLVSGHGYINFPYALCYIVPFSSFVNFYHGHISTIQKEYLTNALFNCLKSTHNLLNVDFKTIANVNIKILSSAVVAF